MSMNLLFWRQPGTWAGRGIFNPSVFSTTPDQALQGRMDFKGEIVLDLEKAMAPHSSTLAWKIPWMEETGRLQSMGSLRVRHD